MATLVILQLPHSTGLGSTCPPRMAMIFPPCSATYRAESLPRTAIARAPSSVAIFFSPTFTFERSGTLLGLGEVGSLPLLGLIVGIGGVGATLGLPEHAAAAVSAPTKKTRPPPLPPTQRRPPSL